MPQVRVRVSQNAEQQSLLAVQVSPSVPQALQVLVAGSHRFEQQSLFISHASPPSTHVVHLSDIVPYACPMTPAAIIESLRLEPHPEGGHYRETWRDAPETGRGAGTAIYYFLQAGERSRWHRLDATEIWHYYAGAPIELLTCAVRGIVRRRVLGSAVLEGQNPQLIVSPDAWQSARSLGDWTLVGCTVAPAFDFERFELAPQDWAP